LEAHFVLGEDLGAREEEGPDPGLQALVRANVRVLVGQCCVSDIRDLIVNIKYRLVQLSRSIFILFVIIDSKHLYKDRAPRFSPLYRRLHLS
jgi:hypothetical protein